jgi:hypothetical protein
MSIGNVLLKSSVVNKLFAQFFIDAAHLSTGSDALALLDSHLLATGLTWPSLAKQANIWKHLVAEASEW